MDLRMTAERQAADRIHEYVFELFSLLALEADSNTPRQTGGIPLRENKQGRLITCFVNPDLLPAFNLDMGGGARLRLVHAQYWRGGELQVLDEATVDPSHSVGRHMNDQFSAQHMNALIGLCHADVIRPQFVRLLVVRVFKVIIRAATEIGALVEQCGLRGDDRVGVLAQTQIPFERYVICRRLVHVWGWRRGWKWSRLTDRSRGRSGG